MLEPNERTFNAEHVCESDNRLLIDVCGDVGHQSKILDETAGLSFRCIAGAEHAPLAGLECTRTADFPCLLKLRADTSHHSKSADERKPAENVCDTSTLHLETFQRPIACTDRAHETGGDVVAHKLHAVERVEL